MKAAFVLAAAGAASAQYFSGEPACATPCLSSAIVAAGCGLNDIACQCGPTQSAIAVLVTPCLLGNCNSGDLGTAESVGLGLCSSWSAGKLTIPTSSAAASTSPAGASQTSSPATTTPVLSTSKAAGSSVSGAPTVYSNSTTAATGTTGGSTVVGPSTTSSAAPTSATKNAAAGVQVNAGLLGALLGALALL